MPSRADGECREERQGVVNGEGREGKVGVLTCSTADAQALTDRGAGDGMEKSRDVMGGRV